MIFHIYFFIFIPIEKQFDSAVNKNAAENGKHPFKLVNKRRQRENKDKTHRNGTDNSPKQYAVIVLFIRSKTDKEHQNHKNIVNGKGFFDNITRDKFQRELIPIELQICIKICQWIENQSMFVKLIDFFQPFDAADVVQQIAEKTQEEEETHCKYYPKQGENQRFFQRYFMAFFVENTQVKR